MFETDLIIWGKEVSRFIFDQEEFVKVTNERLLLSEDMTHEQNDLWLLAWHVCLFSQHNSSGTA
mgnify:CR=1 FL=1